MLYCSTALFFRLPGLENDRDKVETQLESRDLCCTASIHYGFSFFYYCTALTFLSCTAPFLYKRHAGAVPDVHRSPYTKLQTVRRTDTIRFSARISDLAYCHSIPHYSTLPCTNFVALDTMHTLAELRDESAQTPGFRQGGASGTPGRWGERGVESRESGRRRAGWRGRGREAHVGTRRVLACSAPPSEARTSMACLCGRVRRSVRLAPAPQHTHKEKQRVCGDSEPVWRQRAIDC